MKTIAIKQILVVVSFLTTTLCAAQSISIKSVTLQPSDLTAVEQTVLDINGDTCALLKIKTNHLEGIEFPNTNQYVKANYADGVYMVYVPVIGRKLDFRHNNYLSGTIDMGEYGYKRLKGGKTYLVTLNAPNVSELKSSVVIKVEPADAIVKFNGENQEMTTSGTYEIQVSQGNYSYEVKKDNYEPLHGMVNVGKAEVKSLSVKLKPIMHKCHIKGNVSNAHVLVDNVDYGKTGSLMLPQGQHNIRIQADGYIDFTSDVNIMSAMYIPFTMNKNAVITHVHATPVLIYSPNAKRVYKNQKRIKDWVSGQIVMVMPGNYKFTDDLGNHQEVTVGSDTLRVVLSDIVNISPNQNNVDNNSMANSDTRTTTSNNNTRNNYVNSSYNNSQSNYNANSARYNNSPSLYYNANPSRNNSMPSRGYNTNPSRNNSTPSRGYNTNPSRNNSTPSRGYNTNPARSENVPRRVFR